MLFFTFALSLVVLALLCYGWPGRSEPGPRRRCARWATTLLFIGLPLSLLTKPDLMIPISILLTAHLTERYAGYGVAKFRLVTCGTVAIYWLIVGFLVVERTQTYERWRQRVPFESIEERVPQQTPKSAVPADEKRIDAFENAIQMQGVYRGSHISILSNRTESIAFLHQSTVQRFDEAAGFGVVRAIQIHPKAEHFLPDETQPIPQPAGYDPNAVSLGDEPPKADVKFLGLMHLDSYVDFVNPQGFGYVRSRKQVAGFQPHRFSKLPEGVGDYKVERVDLVSLLKHDPPAVYVSADLPRMADAGKLPTRALDAFEADGLKNLLAGQELYQRGDDKAVRVVGALRSVGVCVECHGGQRGDLLGAFSYVLRK